MAEEQLGIPSVMTGKEMATCQEVDKLLMLTYLSQVCTLYKSCKCWSFDKNFHQKRLLPLNLFLGGSVLPAIQIISSVNVLMFDYLL